MQMSDIKWRHRIQLPEGLTAGSKNCEEDLRQWKFPSDLFQDKAVLDVGSCDGFFSFYSEQNGAKEVCAIDPYRYGFDERWSGKNGFNYAREQLNSKVKDQFIQLEEINPDSVGMWDVVLFLGVFYHLPFPCQILEKVASVCVETLVIETLIDPYSETLKDPILKFHPEGFRNHDGTIDKTTYFVPNTLFLNSYLTRIGFQNVETRVIYSGYRSITYAFNRIKNYDCQWGQW